MCSLVGRVFYSFYRLIIQIKEFSDGMMNFTYATQSFNSNFDIVLIELAIELIIYLLNHNMNKHLSVWHKYCLISKDQIYPEYDLKF